jgi:hypothetical protein
MKKIPVKDIKRKNQKKQGRKGIRARGVSWISIILAIAVGSIVIGGFLFIPSTNRKYITNEYVTIYDPDCGEGENLHLCSFVIVTVTPTPRPTRTPNDDEGGGGGGGGGHEPPPGGGGGPKPL